MEAMMQAAFSGAWGTALVRLMNMSAAAGVLICAVVLLRFALRGAPKWIRGILWALVAVQLLCPVTPASPLSVYGLLRRGAAAEQVEVFHASGGSEKPLLTFEAPRIAAQPQPAGAASAPRQAAHSVYLPAAGALWLAGVAALLLYALVSWLRLRRQVRASVPLEGRVMLCDAVASPFILGILRPRIYLPSDLDGAGRAAVLAHEQAHLRRRDHLWKPLGFLLLAVHWFNPLVWLAYVLLCRDIELACDEKVIRDLGAAERADYSQTLLDCSLRRSPVRACPLAFGELGVKERVRRVLNYKKPAFWIIAVAVIACAVVAVCFLTRPGSGGSAPADPSATPRPTPQPTVTPGPVLPGAYDAINMNTAKLYLLNDEFYTDERDPFRSFSILLDPESGMFQYYETPISSYIGLGKYELDGDILTIRDSGTGPERINRFRMEYDKLVWLAEGSDNFLFVKLPDGAVFHLDNTPLAQPRQLTLDDVISLSAKGGDLGWADFEPYDSEEVGSGLYIRRYPIDSAFDLLIGGMSPEEEPAYFHLRNRETNAWIEIRTEDVAAFIEAYGRTEDELLTEPPALAVSARQAGIQALRGSYSWHYENADGTGVGIDADSEHPLMLEDRLPRLAPNPDGISESAPNDVTLFFDVEPDAVSVNCWSDKHWGEYDAAGEDVPVTRYEQFGFTLREGGYIYEITAVWDRSERWGGTAHYSFYGNYGVRTLPGSIPYGTFSFAEVLAETPEGTPNARFDGFVNTEASPVEFFAAAERAKSEVTIDYDSLQIWYDDASDVWAVRFFHSASGGEETVYLGGDGVTRLIVYGE